MTEKKPRARKAKVEKFNPATSLINALKFVAVAQKKAGEVGSQFCKIENGMILASDGILTVGHPIDEAPLTACVHTFQFIDALSKINNELVITQLTENAIAVTSEPFKALVPCVPLERLEMPQPDANIAPLNNALKESFKALKSIPLETSPNACYACVLLQAGSAVATNGLILVEHWHGIDLPPNLQMPLSATKAISESKLDIVGFGYSISSVTIHFENGAFIKTQLYNERYPHYAKIFEVENLNPWHLPEEFFKAVKDVSTFSKLGHIYFNGDEVLSDSNKELSTTYKVEGIPNGMGFQAKLLLNVEGFANKAHFDKTSNKAVFFGDKYRAVVMGLSGE